MHGLRLAMSRAGAVEMNFMTTTIEPKRAIMNGKPVFDVPAKSVLNMESGFRHKLLCDGPTFTAGSACAYSCCFCYGARPNGQESALAEDSGRVRRNGI